MTKIRMFELAILGLLVGAGAYGVVTGVPLQKVSPPLAQPAESRPTQGTVTRAAESIPSASSSPSRQLLPPQSPDHAAKVECMRLIMDGMNGLAKADKEGRVDQVHALTLPSHCEKYLGQQ